MRICDLKNKEVINSNDCKILGFVVDIDVDLYTGRVGPDVIIVNVCEEKVLCKL